MVEGSCEISIKLGPGGAVRALEERAAYLEGVRIETEPALKAELLARTRAALSAAPDCDAWRRQLGELADDLDLNW